MNKTLLLSLMCSVIFGAHGSSMQRARKKTEPMSSENIARTSRWNQLHEGYGETERIPKYQTPGNDTSIEDPGHRPGLPPEIKRRFEEDALHRVGRTFHKDDYVTYDAKGNEVGPGSKIAQINDYGTFYEIGLPLDAIREEHELYIPDLAVFFDLENDELREATDLELREYWTHLNLKERFKKLSPEEKIIQYKKLVELEKSLRSFQYYAAGFPDAMNLWNNPKLYALQLLVQEEYLFVGVLLDLWGQSLTPQSIDAVEQEKYARELEVSKLLKGWLQDMSGVAQ